MMIWIIPLAIPAIAANATMDEIRFHWGRAFGKFIKAGTLLHKWMYPPISWKNKYRFGVFNIFFKTVLVWTTDFWHFLKFVFLNSLFGIITILAVAIGVNHHWLALMIGFNIAWGILYEFFSGIFGVIDDMSID